MSYGPGGIPLSPVGRLSAAEQAESRELVFWPDLCTECTAAFRSWQCAPNPGAWANPKVQASPHLLAFLASCRVTGPDPQAWADTISSQLIAVRRCCTRWHASRRLWEPLERALGYGYPDGFRYGPQNVSRPC
jgi:hypothetical protein